MENARAPSLEVTREQSPMALPTGRAEELTDDGVWWLNAEEERAMFDEATRELLGISGEEFLRLLDAGAYDEVMDDGTNPDIAYLAMLSPVAR